MASKDQSSFQIQSQAPGPWSTGLCDCTDDIGNCCLTCWCPCITFGRVAEIVDRGAVSCGAAGALYTLILILTGHHACLYSCYYRARLRNQYSLEGNGCTDCLTNYFCDRCALCQMHRELQNRGFDMTIRWKGNVERQTRGITTLPPSVPGGMTR